MKKSKGTAMGYKSKTVGNSDDGARKSQKGQTPATLAKNSSANIRQSRVSKMEKRDVKC